jgi:hypothetical protein
LHVPKNSTYFALKLQTGNLNFHKIKSKKSKKNEYNNKPQTKFSEAHRRESQAHPETFRFQENIKQSAQGIFKEI